MVNSFYLIYKYVFHQHILIYEYKLITPGNMKYVLEAEQFRFEKFCDWLALQISVHDRLFYT